MLPPCDPKISMFESKSLSADKSICQSFLQCQPEYINLSANFQKRTEKLQAFNVNLKSQLSTNCEFSSDQSLPILFLNIGWVEGGLNPTFGENSQIVVLSKRPEICQNICSCKIVSKKARDEVSWKYRTCFLFAPHRNGNPAKTGSMEKPKN